MASAIRSETDGAVRLLVLARAEAYNTITHELRDEMNAALDEAERDDSVRVVLLRAEGRAFCAGYGLDWSAEPQADETSWDSNADLISVSPFALTWYRLHTLSKPTVAAVQGWCVGGGCDMVLNADLILAGEAATFGYPPSRVWGVPHAPWTWVARLGLQRAKRHLLTGDEISGAEAARIGLALECVPDGELEERARALAQRIAMLSLNQLQMVKRVLNDSARRMYDPEQSIELGVLYDGIARHTPEGIDFVRRAKEAGFRQAVRERDDPFGDYGSRPRGE